MFPERRTGLGTEVICRILYIESEYICDKPAHKIVPYETQLREAEGEAEMAKKKLYQILGEENAYGEFLARRKDGSIVLEMKDGSGVRTVMKDGLEEVKPYTVSARYISDSNSTRSYDFFAVEGTFEPGDLIWADEYDQILRVVEIDTKSDRAAKWLAGTKLVGERIEAGD